jgi:hypothetical protein
MIHMFAIEDIFLLIYIDLVIEANGTFYILHRGFFNFFVFVGHGIL